MLAERLAQDKIKRHHAGHDFCCLRPIRPWTRRTCRVRDLRFPDKFFQCPKRPKNAQKAQKMQGIPLFWVGRGPIPERNLGISGRGALEGPKAPCRTRPRREKATRAAWKHCGEGGEHFSSCVLRLWGGRIPERYPKTPLFNPTPRHPFSTGRQSRTATLPLPL